MIRNAISKSIRLADRGIDLWDSLENMHDGEAVITQNMIYRKGIQSRFGNALHFGIEVSTPNPIVGLHRFYYDVNEKTLIAASGTNVSSMNDTDGTWTVIRATQTFDTPTNMVTWGSLNKMYVSNGVDIAFSIDNALADTDLSAAPDLTWMLLPYRDRLLSIDRTNPSYIQWCGAAYDTTTWTSTADAIRVPGPGAIEVIANHSISNTSTGYDAQVFVAKPTSCYLFSGTNLDPASDTFNVRLDPIGGPTAVGCVSPNTVRNTPKGTIFLGSDAQVYILPFGSAQVVAIGHKIQSQRRTTTIGLESAPFSSISKAAAIYHDGFYKLTFPVSGSSFNSVQYWLDVDRLGQDDDEVKHFGPWYGPMTGMNISIFCLQNGSTDDGQLIGGEAATAGSVLYRCNEVGVFDDNGTAISMVYQTKHEPYVNPLQDARIMETELEISHPKVDATLKFFDTTGLLDEPAIIPLSSGGLYWGTFYWGDEYWDGAGPVARKRIELYDRNVNGRLISTYIEYSSTTDQLFIYAINHLAKPIRRVFATYA